jgi:hypothetical protein
MARVIDKRANAPLCGARKKSGETCRNYAGYGTDHKGVGTCKFHFGNAQAHKKHAVKVEAEQRLRVIGQPLDINPIDALLWTVRISAGHIVLIQQELEKLDEPTMTHEGRVLLTMWDSERDRLAKTAKLAVDAGVAEKAIRLAEMYGELLARLIKGILVDLKLTVAQDAISGEVVRRHLMAMDQGQGYDGPLALPPAAS